MSTVIPLDLCSEELSGLLAAAPVYEKLPVVSARVAEADEAVVTVLADGREETSNLARPGDVIVTNPGGERYVLDPETFSRRYREIADGRFQATGMVRALRNPAAVEIEIVAPWGELMRGGPDCWIAMAYDPTQPEQGSLDRYLIGAEEFAASYRQLT